MSWFVDPAVVGIVSVVAIVLNVIGVLVLLSRGRDD
jgi:hypothetical protein